MSGALKLGGVGSRTRRSWRDSQAPGGLLQPGDGLLLVAESKADLSHQESSDILLGPSPFQFAEDLESGHTSCRSVQV